MKRTKHLAVFFLLRLALVGALLVSFTVSLAPPHPALADPGNGTGPGGVGNQIGSSTLELWLRADRGASTDSGCATDAGGDGDLVRCWRDLSGNGNHVSAPADANRPSFESDPGNALNGFPVLEFGNSGDNRYLQRDVTANLSGQTFTLIALSVPAATTAEYASVFASASANDTNGSFQLDSGGAAGCDTDFRFRYYISPNDGNTCAGDLDTAPRIISIRVTSGTNISAWNNGTNFANNAASTLGPIFDSLRVGLDRGGTAAWPNDIAEVILYYEGLSTPKRVIVENYLQAKYNDSTLNNLTIANDKYDGDTTANGDFDLDVAGIGRDGQTHVHAHSAGMMISNYSPAFLTSPGDYLMFGHRDTSNDITAMDLPSSTGWGGANDARWVRHWYLDVTDVGGNGGMVSIAFDFGEGGMLAAPAGPVSNYRLLRRAGPSGAFEDFATASTYDPVARTVTFNPVDVALLGSNFTIGTLDHRVSPIGDSPTAVSMVDTATAAVPGGARVSWTTAQEINTVLFKLQRATAPDGERTLVQEVLPLGQGMAGASYEVEDLGLQPGRTYYYWLEAISLEGSETFDLDPVTTFSSSLFLPLMLRSP